MLLDLLRERADRGRHRGRALGRRGHPRPARLPRSPLADTPSVLVLTLREHTPDPPPRFTETLGHLARSARMVRLPLSPLSRRRRVAARRGARRHARTGARRHGRQPVLRHRGALPPGATRCPPRCGTRSWVARPRLSEGARAALEAAAVVPDRIELDLLYAVSGCTAGRSRGVRAGRPAAGRAARRVVPSRARAQRRPRPPVRRTPPGAARGRRRAPDHRLRAPRVADRAPRRPRRRLGHGAHLRSRRCRAVRTAQRPPRGGRPDGPRTRPSRGEPTPTWQPRSSVARPRPTRPPGDWTRRSTRPDVPSPSVGSRVTTTSPSSSPTSHASCGCWPAARRRARRWTRPCVWSPTAREPRAR